MPRYTVVIVIILCLSLGIAICQDVRKPSVPKARSSTVVKLPPVSKNPAPLMTKTNAKVLVAKKMPFRFVNQNAAGGDLPSYGGASPAYSGENGLMLDLVAPVHVPSGSHVAFFYVTSDDALRQKIASGQRGCLAQAIYPGSKDDHPTIIQGEFGKLPTGMHTYVLTVNVQATDPGAGIRINVDDESFAGDAIITTDHSQHSVFFAYDSTAAKGKLPFTVTWTGSRTRPTGAGAAFADAWSNAPGVQAHSYLGNASLTVSTVGPVQLLLVN